MKRKKKCIGAKSEIIEVGVITIEAIYKNIYSYNMYVLFY